MNKTVYTFDPHQNSSESVEILLNESINLQENHLEIMLFAQWGGGRSIILCHKWQSLPTIYCMGLKERMKK